MSKGWDLASRDNRGGVSSRKRLYRGRVFCEGSEPKLRWSAGTWWAIAGRVPSLATGVASLSSHLDAEPKMHRPGLRGEKSLGPEVLRCKLPPVVCWLRSFS